MGGACSAYEGKERCAQGFGGETEGKKLLGRSRRRWEDNISGSGIWGYGLHRAGLG